MNRIIFSYGSLAPCIRLEIGALSKRAPRSSVAVKGKNIVTNNKFKFDVQKFFFTTSELSEQLKNTASVFNSSKEGSWVSIASTPHFATLDDVLLGVSQSMEYIRSREDTPFLVPARKTESEAEELVSLSEYQQIKNLSCHMAIEARLMLSQKKRPIGWFIRFPHSSIADEFVRESKSIKTPCKIGWKRVFPAHFEPFLDKKTLNLWREPVEILKLDNASVRMENVPFSCTEDVVRSYFRWFEIADDSGGKPPAVVKLIEAIRLPRYAEGTDSGHKAENIKKWSPRSHTFLVRFSDASVARAAVRERHLGQIMGQKIYLNQYPGQLLFDCN